MDNIFFNIHNSFLNFCLISDKILLIILILYLIIDITIDYKYKNTVKYIQFYISKIIFSLFIIIINLIIILLFNIHPSYINNQYYFFNNQLIINNGILSLKIIIIIILILILLTMYDNIKLEKILCLEIPIILLISILGMFIILCSNDLLILGLGLELQTMPFFILSCLKRTSNLSVEAALKYFIYACFCSSISFFGISLIYGFLGTTNFLEIKIILNINKILNFYSLYISLCFILIGLLFKLGLVPFHF
jgi:NADH-quinone oxidoreductase subunit N